MKLFFNVRPNLLWQHWRFFVQLLTPTNLQMPNMRYILLDLLCPQLRKNWWGILVSGCACARSWKNVHARILKFHIWIPHGKIVETRFFFLSELSPFLELCPFEKIKTISDICHILWTVHTRIFKFHKWIPHGKIADLNFFSSSYLPFWSYASLKKSEWNLVSKMSQKVFELGVGAWNLVSW